MTPFFIGLLTCFSAFLRSRYNLSLEILALRQQLGVLKRKRPRPRLLIQNRFFWILLRRVWPAWRDALVIVQPDTVVVWHRTGFRLFWRLRSRPRSLGRPKIEAEVRALIQRMVDENSTWGAPRIHGELFKLGFDVSERTVSRYLRRLYPRDQAQLPSELRWWIIRPSGVVLLPMRKAGIQPDLILSTDRGSGCDIGCRNVPSV